MRGRGSRFWTFVATAVMVFTFIAGPGLAIASPLSAGSSTHRAHRVHHVRRAQAKPPAAHPVVLASRPHPTARRVGSSAVPSPGPAPAVSRSHVSRRVTGRKPAAFHKPAVALLPKRGRVVIAAPSPRISANRAKVGGHVRLGPAHPGAGRLIIPPPSGAHGARAKGFTPSAFYSSTQLDNFSASCGFGANETTIAQSTTNPNLLVAGANTYYDNSGGCTDSVAGVYYSSDGGQHWKYQVMPGLLFPAAGDPVVTFDPVRQVFVFAFVEFNRSDGTQGRIGVEVSSDGVSWSRNTTLDSNTASYGTDKPSITVDQNPSSPHYGRVVVAWTQFFGNNAVYQDDYTDDGGVTWHTDTSSINFTSHECGNGTSAAFNANGELMVAWADCSGGVNSVYEELSTDGGANWTAASDTQISTTHPIAGAEDPNAADCLLNAGGSSFRCNSFPTLAGDPNSGDAGGTAFVVSWAEERSTTQNSQTATVSQIFALSTVDDGGTWDHPALMNFNNFGDKFFPAASFSPNGRLTVSYSSREDDASSGNPNGKRFNEHQTEAGSLTALRAASYVTYTTDSTLGDPGTLAFIGDYAGNTSLDQNFDTFPIWTDLRNGFPSIRTQDLCYANCMTFLSPDAPLSVSRSTGSSFSDFYELSMDPTTGSGNNFWNVVGLRPGTDGTSIDDDTFLAPNHYFNSSLTSSAQSPPRLDYMMVNGNSGNAPNTVYFPQVNSFSSLGGSYSLEWDAGRVVLGTSHADSMGTSNVARVYDAFLNTATKYYVGLRPDPGNSSNYSLALHSASPGAYQGRLSAAADSGNTAPGIPALIQYSTGSDPSQYDGVVVLNNNSGSGSYSLYSDTVAPTGTIQIDGGAASTSSTTLNLTLSATNPTPGDPVSEMSFSVNGGRFGAYRPYATSATVTVPAGEGTQTVKVAYRNGAGAVSTPKTATIYLVQTPPTITGLSPNAGSTAGGNTVTINGTHFAPGATVKFGTTASGTVTFVSATQIKAVAPAHSAGTTSVRVTTPAGTSPFVIPDEYAYGAPVITGLSPNGGSTAGGNTVTINGSGFVPGATVKFGTTASGTVTFVSANQIKAVAPAHAAGTTSVRVSTAAGTSAYVVPDEYAYGPPAITSVSPTSGPTGGGTTVTINGNGFAPGTTVKFGATASGPVTFVSPNQIKAVAPAHAAGTVDVTATTGGGTSAAVAADHYTY